MKKSSTAFTTADILLPSPDRADMSKWAVVACDQFTSQPEYWEDAARIAKGSPSALNLILPEAYLENPDSEEMIKNIHSTMNEYINNSIFTEYKDSFVYIERTDSTGKVRPGLIGMIDLEQYDYSKGSTSPVRATEATVAERIPPRLKVRRGAPLELPHIMILIDDPEKTVIEKLSEEKDSFPLLYSFDLMKNGGSITGRLVNGEAADKTDAALAALGERSAFEKRSGVAGAPLLLYAMGDGNHSLATAKAYYEELKKANPDKDMSSHPARYALAEIVNLHCDALCFEAIHRIIEGIDTENMLSEMTSALGLTEEPSEGQSFVWVCGGSEKRYYITKPTSNLTVGSVQSFIDEYLKAKGGKVDYIHGADVVRRLAEKEACAGILLPDMGKDELFPTVIKDGALPRKTFSMGHAEDKRYYVEARRISL